MTSREQDEAVRLLTLLRLPVPTIQNVETSTGQARRHIEALERQIDGGSAWSWAECWHAARVAVSVLSVGIAVVLVNWFYDNDGRRFSLHRPTSSLAHVIELRGRVGVTEPAVRERSAQKGQALSVNTGINVGADSVVQLQLASGAQVEAGAGSRVSLGQPELGREDVVLHAGSVAFRVPKLPSGHRLTVSAPDTLVTVFGTAFRVVMQGPTSATEPRMRTCVTVSEGGVLVEHSGRTWRVEAGARWSSDGERCSSEFDPTARALGMDSPAVDSTITPDARHNGVAHAAAAPTGAPPFDLLARTRTSGTSLNITDPNTGTSGALGTTDASSADTNHASTDALASGTQKSSTLGEQNALFAEGVRARRRGEFGLALRLFEQLLSRYPDSPLAEQTQQERATILGSRAVCQDAAQNCQDAAPNASGAHRHKEL